MAIGLWGASAGVGIALGPIAGGWLLERFWWGAIFLFMVPVAAVVAAMTAWWVPTSRDPRTPPVDWRGLVLSAAGMGLVIYGIIQAPGWGWASAATTGVPAAGVVALAVLVTAERRTASPMIDMSLFRNLRFTAASGSVAIAFFALLGFIFLMTQYLQVVHAYTPLSTGVRLLPVAASVGVASTVGTRLAVPLGNKVIVGGGLALVCAALLWISTESQLTSYGIIAAQMVVFGIGMGMTQAPATEAIMGAVPKEKAGVALAVNGSTRLFGGTLGVAVIGSVAASLYTSQLAAVLHADLPARALTAARAGCRPAGRVEPRDRESARAPSHGCGKLAHHLASPSRLAGEKAHMSDFDLIRNTIARNNQYLDDRRYDDCSRTFTQDGSIAGHKGRAAILEFMLSQGLGARPDLQRRQ